MSMLCFFPWAGITERLVFGSFHLAPCGEALASGEISADLRDAIGAILEAYGFRRDVDRARVPILRHEGKSFTADLSDDEVAEYFEFRTRLTFAALAARQFFGHRYCNSDNLRLVIQGFSVERAGGALITTRRRDGAQSNMVPRGVLRVPRPMHVAPSCQLPLDLDSPLLDALELAGRTSTPSWPRLEEGIRLFVGANSDSSDVGPHAEVVDTVSAFSRLADAWDEKGTVDGFLAALPASNESDAEGYGPKAADQRLRRTVASGRPVRAAWLSDAYVLRSQYGHGRVGSPPYRSTWSVHEHLLLGALAFPLMVKAMLASEGMYLFTDMDVTANNAFDTLATFDPFATLGEDERHPWRDTLARISLRPLAHALAAALEAQAADKAPAEPQRPEDDKTA
jgi:hypothetical protein